MYKFTQGTRDTAVCLGQGVTLELFNLRVFVLPSGEKQPGGHHGVQTTAGLVTLLHRSLPTLSTTEAKGGIAMGD